MTSHKLWIALAAITALTTVAEARPRPNGQLSGPQFDANKTFGLGLELGAPFGLNGKYFLNSQHALDFGIGDDYSYFGRNGLHIYGDFLFHPISIANTDAFELPFYVGVGGRVWNFNDNNGVNSATAIGFRVPLGVSLDFNNVPIDVFFQLVPTLDFFANYAPHTVYLDVDASIGVRYWFN